MPAMQSSSQESAFGRYLLDQALLSEEMLRQAESVSADTFDPLVRSLAKLGFVPENRLADALASFSKRPRSADRVLLTDALDGLSVGFLRFHGIVPVNLNDAEVTLAICNPLDDAGVRGIEFATGRRTKS